MCVPPSSSAAVAATRQLFQRSAAWWSVRAAFLGTASEVSVSDLRRVAKLAKLRVAPQDESSFVSDLQRMVYFMNQLSDIPGLAAHRPMYSPVEDRLQCPRAADEPAQDAMQAQVLRNSASVKEGFFAVDKVIQQQQQGE